MALTMAGVAGIKGPSPQACLSWEAAGPTPAGKGVAGRRAGPDRRPPPGPGPCRTRARSVPAPRHGAAGPLRGRHLQALPV